LWREAAIRAAAEPWLAIFEAVTIDDIDYEIADGKHLVRSARAEATSVTDAIARQS
jgi:hypothetical protein